MDDIPLLEFDSDKTALIEPGMAYQKQDIPEACVMLFYGSVINKLRDEGIVNKVSELTQYGITIKPVDIFKATTPLGDISLIFPGVGAPLSAAVLEELIALGCRKFVACGPCGVLKPELKRGTVIIPDAAVRDEGTSYHYLPPSRTVAMNPEAVQKLAAVLKKHNIEYEIGKTWTTDAFYRETKTKISRRKAENCITVEMECSALISVAKFRNVLFGQYLSAADDISGERWDPRIERNKMSFEEKMFWLSVEAVLSL